MKTYYEVRFTLYHYNTCDGRNGHYLHEQKFQNATEAIGFANRLRFWLTEGVGTERFAEDYCGHGYLVSVDGTYEITERRVFTEDFSSGYCGHD